ncbi:unnamed protein product [Chilo suppressalis]|uniref:Uncharacterized protein n=1 Tax=Chilo suppressalis TaxID=168631 RepID=A0ABN8AQE6_CHISP|nr:unnamed protein product [Chilo suppressalis]
MGFISHLADSIPGLGHIKGLYHYLNGEEEKGDEAMYQSSRSSGVMVGSIFGGPWGGVAAGMAIDCTASALMDEEKGLVRSCMNMAEDISSNTNPAYSVMDVGFHVGFDALSGYGGGASKSFSSEFGKNMKRSVTQSIQKSVRISAAEIAKMGGRQSSKRLATATAVTVSKGVLKAAKTSQTDSKCVLIAAKTRQHRERKRYWKEEQDSDMEDEHQSEWREFQLCRECKHQEELRKREEQHRERKRYDEEEQDSDVEFALREEQDSDMEDEHQIELSDYQLYKVLGKRQEELRKLCVRGIILRELSGPELFLGRSNSMYDQSENKQNNQSEQQKSKKQEESKKREQRANSEKQNRNTSGSTSVSPQPPQPPQGNKDNNEKGKKNNKLTFFENFLTLLRKILNIVYGKKREPFSILFQELSKADKKYLKKILQTLVNSSSLEAVIELVIRMFQQHFPQDISFLNFISLLEFTQSYVMEEVKDRTLISSGTETAEAKMTPKERRDKIIFEIASEEDIVQKLFEQFKELKIEIEAETEAWNKQFPNFRDIFAAVYHYFKHRRLPHDGKILSVKEYYDWIRKYLKEVEQTQKFTKLKQSNRTYVHQIFESQFRRRFKIVLNCHGDEIVLTGELPSLEVSGLSQKVGVSLVAMTRDAAAVIRSAPSQNQEKRFGYDDFVEIPTGYR